MQKYINKRNNLDTRLKEFLWTTFFVVIVYELIAKVFWSWIIESIHCVSDISLLSADKILSNKVICYGYNLLNYIPKGFFSTFHNADKNFIITILSTFFTALLFFGVYRIAKYLYFHSVFIRRYMKQRERRELYIDDFGGILLLAFIIIGIMLCILYPIFGIGIILTLLVHKNREE